MHGGSEAVSVICNRSAVDINKLHYDPIQPPIINILAFYITEDVIDLTWNIQE